MKLSRCFIQTDSSAPNTVCLQSPCNPTLKPANFLDSQHHIFLPPPLFSTPLLHIFSHISRAFLYPLISPHSLDVILPSLSTSPSPPLRWPLAKAPGTHSVVAMAEDCGIPAADLMILPPGPDQPEKYSNHFSTERELLPLHRLCEMYMCICIYECVHCAQTFNLDFGITS